MQYILPDSLLRNSSIVHRNRLKLAAQDKKKISGLMSKTSKTGESREERLTRTLHGAHSLLLQDITVDYNDPVIRRRLTHEFWMVLMQVKFHARVDRRLKDEFLNELRGQAYGRVAA